MKQTALEWLEEKMKTWGDLPRWMRDDIVEQAKEMEKEQIMEAHYWGVLNRNKHNSIPQSDVLKDEIDRIGKGYYNETFKPKQR